MSLKDKKFIRTKTSDSNQPLVTISGGSFSFNSKFVKEFELKKYSRVTFYIDEENFKVGFEFHSNILDKNSHSLQIRGGTALTKAQEAIFNTPFLKKVNSLISTTDKRFPAVFDRVDRLYVISVCPAFEIKTTILSEIDSEARGIYRYLDENNVVYIGKGRIKSRANSPERADWKFDVIEYSIVENEEAQIEWESYWIKRYREDNNTQLPRYNKISGHAIE